MNINLTPRQIREVEYHRSHAAKHASEATDDLDMTVVHDDRRRWWNGYWHVYTLLRGMNLEGKKVLVPGCGHGKDVARVAALGADVYGFDISPEMVDLARRRMAGSNSVHLDLAPSEKLPYPDGFFDVVFFCDILHHVDIPTSLAEIRRVMKPGGEIVGSELYTHDFLQWFRTGWLVERVLYPLMKRFIYRTDDPYITEDEHKISQGEFALVRALSPDMRVDHFDLLIGRLIPQAWPRAFHKADRLAMRALGPLGGLLAGRVVFSGQIGSRS